MIPLFPAATLLALAAAFSRSGARRRGVVVAALVWGVLVLAVSEGFGLFGALTRGALTVVWTVAFLSAAAWAWHRRRRRAERSPRSLDGLTAALVAATLLLVAATGAAALLSPPNNWDALDYHLPRQVRWRQQASLSTWAAADERQFAFPPFNELVGLQTFVLSGDDRFANLGSWLGFALSTVAASLLAARLGCGQRGQALAALLAASQPGAAMQAENPKNDVVLGFFFLASSIFIHEWVEGLDERRSSALLAGVALGLMVCTKSTGLLLAAPLVVWLVVKLALRRERAGGRRLALAALLAILPNVGWVSRNLSAFGRPFKPPGGPAYEMTTHAPNAVVSNVVRNALLHVASPGATGDVLRRAALRFHELIGIDPNDPRTTLEHTPRFGVATIDRDENYPRAPLHVWASLLALGILVGTRRIETVALVPFAAFLLFCAVVRWQIWNGRLHIPILALLSVVIAVAVERLGAAPVAAVGTSAFLYVIPWLLFSVQKPLATAASVLSSSDESVLFRQHPERAEALYLLINEVRRRRPNVIGLSNEAFNLEYLVERELLELSPVPLIVCLEPMALRGVPRDPPAELAIWFRRQAQGDPEFAPPAAVIAHQTIIHSSAHLVADLYWYRVYTLTW